MPTIAHMGRLDAGHARRRAPPGYYRFEALRQRQARTEAEQPLRFFRASDAMRDKTLRLGSVLDLQLRTGQLQQQRHELVDARADAHADVEVLVSTLGLHPED